MMSRLAFLLLAVQGQIPAPSPAGTPSAPPQAPCPQPSVTLPATLDRVLRDYEAAWGRGDETALASLFSEDGFILPMGGVPVRGRPAIEKEYSNAGGQPLFLRALAYGEEKTMAFILGCYAFAAGQPDQGKFTLTLKKRGDGPWLIFSDMDNPNRRSVRPPTP